MPRMTDEGIEIALIGAPSELERACEDLRDLRGWARKVLPEIKERIEMREEMGLAPNYILDIIFEEGKELLDG